MAQCPSCSTTIDPASDSACPGCGAPITSGASVAVPAAPVSGKPPVTFGILDASIPHEEAPPDLLAPPRRAASAAPPPRPPSMATPDVVDSPVGLPLKLIAIAAIVISLFVGFGALMPKHITLSPGLQASRFFKAARDRDWGTLYNLSEAAERAYPMEAAYASRMNVLMESGPYAQAYAALFVDRRFHLGKAKIEGSYASIPYTALAPGGGGAGELRLHRVNGIWKITGDSGPGSQITGAFAPVASALGRPGAPIYSAPQQPAATPGQAPGTQQPESPDGSMNPAAGELPQQQNTPAETPDTAGQAGADRTPMSEQPPAGLQQPANPDGAQQPQQGGGPAGSQ